MVSCQLEMHPCWFPFEGQSHSVPPVSSAHQFHVGMVVPPLDPRLDLCSHSFVPVGMKSVSSDSIPKRQYLASEGYDGS